ncbi:two-component regulator propeller domain-containing protein [Fluviicola sp.]|uniref:ligand-binding sensor domain-containing protein n=1 Tax=Fluviicola sp. TaxID=1917219 RepID=UPI00262B8C0B|nr:two-component regulator propeller domain-containing protein [Fluviicola sp.]
MKTILISIAISLFLYSAQTMHISKQKRAVLTSIDLDDSVYYGPQLPCYYSNAISEYVRRILQDSKGNLWFGTNTDGVAMYDGEKLSYINTPEGLGGSQVTGIIEDKHKNIWFSTSNGVTKYNPSTKIYLNFGEKEGLCHASVWSIFQDSKGTIWAGTYSGLCRFNGNQFERFAIPKAEASWIRSITEDRKGNLWFGTADQGAFQFDGIHFRQFSQKDGLCSNDLTCILEDGKGNIWFSSMDNGISKYDGKSFQPISSENGIGNNEVWTMYEDRNGAVWFSSEGFGVYRYMDGKLTNFGEKEGLRMPAVQSVYQDNKGKFWFGGGNGLYLYNNDLFTPITKNGPWEGGC